MSKLRIVLVDDHPDVRQGLRTLLSMANDIEIVGEAENGVEAVALVQATLPELVVMDFSMPLLNGVEATKQIQLAHPSAKVLVLSSYGEREFIRKVKRAGAAGYIAKDAVASDLLRAIHAIRSGRKSFIVCARDDKATNGKSHPRSSRSQSCYRI